MIVRQQAPQQLHSPMTAPIAGYGRVKARRRTTPGAQKRSAPRWRPRWLGMCPSAIFGARQAEGRALRVCNGTRSGASRGHPPQMVHPGAKNAHAVTGDDHAQDEQAEHRERQARAEYECGDLLRRALFACDKEPHAPPLCWSAAPGQYDGRRTTVVRGCLSRELPDGSGSRPSRGVGGIWSGASDDRIPHGRPGVRRFASCGRISACRTCDGGEERHHAGSRGQRLQTLH